MLTRGTILVGLIAIAACGSESPTAPQIPAPTPPPEPPAPAVEVNWLALARLYDDPLFRQLPALMRNEPIGQSMSAAVSELIAGIRARDLEKVKTSLAKLHDLRVAYMNSPSYDLRDRLPGFALSLFELRGKPYFMLETPGLIRGEVQFAGEGG